MRHSRSVIAVSVAAALALSGLTAVTTRHAAAAGSSPPLIAFDDDANGVFEFAPGGNPTLVAPAGVFPAFSPNGLNLAYELEHAQSTGDPNATNTIVVAGRTGGSPQTILSGPVSWDGSTKNDVEYPIAWTPDGNDIAYGCDGSTDTTEQAGRVAQVCEVNVDTGAHHMITSATNDHPLSEGGGTNQRLSFTPDGKHIIATVLGETIDCLAGQPNLGECRVLEIASIDVASGAVKLLTTYDAETNRASSDAQLSPDGSSIVYFQVSDSSSAATRVDTGVAIMDSGGGNGHVIYSGYSPGATDPPYAESLTWSPDGKDVLFVSYGDGDDDYRLKAYLIAANGTGDPYKFTQDNYNVFDPSWAPVLTTCTVPDLKHKTLKHAKNELKKAACTLGKVKGPKKHRSKRKIVSQSPKANKEEPAGTKVNVTLG